MDWTEEKIANYTLEQIKALRQNAARLGRQQVVDRCDAELLRRKPVKTPRPRTEQEHRAGHYVSEFHFVCPNELGVTRNPDGSLSTGVWVVAATNAKAAEKFGSIVALHTTRAEASYLQGTIISWCEKPRDNRYSGDQATKTKTGIEFTFKPTGASLTWKGEATGEKGYEWLPIPA